MQSQSNRRGLKRMGKNAGQIFGNLSAPMSVVEDQVCQRDGLLSSSPMLAWGLWWQDMCYLQTKAVNQYLWSGSAE